MKRLFTLFCWTVCAVVALSCSREKVIPDPVLAQIFRDAYLTNAYIDERQIRFDSLEIYEPIFRRYGYTAENFRYTIGSFSRRKSANLSDVVEQAIAMLESEAAYYKREVAVLDTIDNVARRRYTRPFYADSLIRVSRLRDTAKLRIALRMSAGRVQHFVRLPDRFARRESHLADETLAGGGVRHSSRR